MNNSYDIGYNSAYLEHLAKLTKETKARFEGVPPFAVLIAVAIFVHFSFLVPIYILDITKDIPDLKQVRVAFGVDTTRTKTDLNASNQSSVSQIVDEALENEVKEPDPLSSPKKPNVAAVPTSKNVVPIAERRNTITASSPQTDTKAVINKKTKKTRRSSLRRPAPARGVRATGAAANAGDSTAAVRKVKSKYERLLSGWVDRHKVYPDSAYSNNIQGEVVLRLRINRKGYVIIKSIEKSSGHKILDKAVLETVSRASPMPVVPEEYPGGKHLEFLIPIAFQI